MSTCTEGNDLLRTGYIESLLSDMAASDFEMGVTHYRRICTASEFQFTAFSYFCRKKKSLSG
jgi:hypothetical protein